MDIWPPNSRAVGRQLMGALPSCPAVTAEIANTLEIVAQPPKRKTTGDKLRSFISGCH